jgi:hypothetical protein
MLISSFTLLTCIPNQALSDELKFLKSSRTAAATGGDPSAQSSRSSIDSSRGGSLSRLSSPVPHANSINRGPTGSPSPSGEANGQMDYTYLKNVLLQFLEQKDKKHQMQLVPVLAMLLKFDKKDEVKWSNAIKGI